MERMKAVTVTTSRNGGKDTMIDNAVASEPGRILLEVITRTPI